MGKSAPPAPDYRGAAEEQAASSKEVTNQQTWANRPTQVTPWGTQSWQTESAVDPATGQPVTKWTGTTTLSPQQQAALDSQMRVTTARSMGAEAMLQNALGNFGVNLDPASYSGQSPTGQPGLLSGSGSGGARPIDYSGITIGGKGVDTPDISTSIGDTQTQMTGAPQAINQQMGFGGFGQVQGGLTNPNAPTQATVQGGNIQRGLGNVGNVNMGIADAGPVAREFGDAGSIQAQLQNTAGDWRQQGQQAALDFMRPLQQERQAALESQLANMGLTRGSEAWNREMRSMQDQNMRDQLQAFQAGQSEANMLFGMDQARGQFANSAQQQAFNQAMGRGQFSNAAQQQQFSQNVGMNQALNQAQNQAFQQAMGAGQFSNQAQAQQFQQDSANADRMNSLQQQFFQQAVASGQFANAAQAQQFAQQQAQAAFANQSALAQNQTNMQQAAFQNQLQAQEFQQLMQQAQYGNTAAQQRLNMDLQSAQFNQQLRQQQIAEMLQMRAQPLNELNALLTGQQIGMPSMPSFNQAQRAETTQYSQAAQNQYQAGMDAFNAKQQQVQGLMSGMGSIAGMFMSDKRLKKDIKFLFKLPNGINVYSYRFIGKDQLELGVLAQEVQEVMPDAVAMGSDGFYRVNYSKVLA